MCDLSKKLNLYGVAPGSIVDGPGIRYGVFCQGCSHNCAECHNPDSHDYNAGTKRSIQSILEDIKSCKSCSGVTFSGGEPFDQAKVLCELACALKKDDYNIWVYTGYLFENLLKIANGNTPNYQSKYCNLTHKNAVKKLLENIDVLVDGPFKKDLKSYSALFVGSSNQRVIDIKKSLQSKNIVLWENNFVVPDKPRSW